MSDFCSVRAKIIPVDQSTGPMPELLITRLTEFTQQHYDVKDIGLFIENILRPQQSGSVIVYYGETDELVGYSRVYQQCFTVEGKQIIVYSSNTCQDQSHNLNAFTARLGLTEIMKYKLAHPDDGLVYVSCIDSPLNYQFLAGLPNSIYPKADAPIPDQVLDLVKMIKEQNNWDSSPAHPMLITNQPKRLRSEPIPATYGDDPLIDYYLSINPGYTEGCALLAYIPLSLANIGHALRKLISQTNHGIRHPNQSRLILAEA